MELSDKQFPIMLSLLSLSVIPYSVELSDQQLIFCHFQRSWLPRRVFLLSKFITRSYILPARTLKPQDLQRSIPASYRPSFRFWSIQGQNSQKKRSYTVIQQHGDSLTRPWLQMRSFITFPSVSRAGTRSDATPHHNRNRRSPDGHRRHSHCGMLEDAHARRPRRSPETHRHHSHSSSRDNLIREKRHRSKSDSRCDYREYPPSKKWKGNWSPISYSAVYCFTLCCVLLGVCSFGSIRWLL